MNKLRLFFLLFLTLLSLPLMGAEVSLLHYTPGLWVLKTSQSIFLVLRTWVQDSKQMCWALNPENLETSFISTSPEALIRVNWLQASKYFPKQSQTLYFRLRQQTELQNQPLANAGVTHWDAKKKGAWLTFDLCPSHKPLDRWIFLELQSNTLPLNVFLEVSGLWIERHDEDFNWLLDQQNNGKLHITWVNHSENHDYEPESPLDHNFLLLPGTQLNQEIFLLEQRLIKKNQCPSIFFRFPGLISSPELVNQILNWGLIPLGSESWLNKNQTVKVGSFVLTHANGNEPSGLKLLKAWNKSRPEEWNWLGLQDFL